MADEIRVTGPDRPAPPVGGGPAAAPAAPVVQGAPPPAPAVIDDDPDAARAEIEATRARMSDTISDIGEALARRKERIQDRLDVLSPVKENPLPSGAIAFGAGLLLGLITGGDDDDADRWDEETRRYPSVPWEPDGGRDEWTAASQERAETWESRARRLRDVARRQQEEIRALQESWGEHRAQHLEGRGGEEHRRDAGGGITGPLDELRERIVTGVSDYLANAVRDVFAPAGKRGG